VSITRTKQFNSGIILFHTLIVFLDHESHPWCHQCFFTHFAFWYFEYDVRWNSQFLPEYLVYIQLSVRVCQQSVCSYYSFFYNLSHVSIAFCTTHVSQSVEVIESKDLVICMMIIVFNIFFVYQKWDTNTHQLQFLLSFLLASLFVSIFLYSPASFACKIKSSRETRIVYT